ncbi:MAG: hypothetical protein P4L51_28485 [Puia sp.]|nr:hypothetical protein [Puia sp.]
MKKFFKKHVVAPITEGLFAQMGDLYVPPPKDGVASTTYFCQHVQVSRTMIYGSSNEERLCR